MNCTRLFSRAAALLILAASLLSTAVADQLPFTANQVAQLAYNQGFRGGSLMTAVAVASAESSFDPDAVCNNLHEIDAANNPLFYPNGKPRIAIIATYDGTMLPLNQIYNLSSGGRGRVIGHCRGLWQVNTLQHPTIKDSDTFTPSIAVRRAWGISRGGRFWGKWTSVMTGAAWQPARLSAARAAARAIDPTVLQENAPAGTRVRAWTTGGGVRATPGGTFHRGIRIGDTGTLLAGPVIASITEGPLTSQHLWYQVQWDHGTTGWCVEEYLTQTTLPVQTASPAYNPLPENGKLRVPVNQVALWWAIGGNTKEVRVRFGTDPALTAAGTLVVSGALTNTWTANNLQNYRDYYWRVDSVSANNSVVQGPTWTFRTAPLPPQPVTLSNITVTPRPAGRGQTLTISGTVSSPGAQPVLLGASVGAYSDPARDTAFTVPGGNVPTQFSRSFVLPADIPFGTHAVTIGAWQDLNGNGTIEAGDVKITEASAATAALVADITLPTLANLSASSPTNLPNQLVQLSATASDSGGSGLVGVYFYRAVSETTPSLGSWQVVAYRPATGSGPVTLTAQDNPTVEGRYWYEMEAIDGAGNRRRVSAGTLRIQIPDLAPPVAKWLNPENGATIGGGGITVTGQATDDRTVASVYYRINGGAWTQVFQNFNNWSVFVNLEHGSNLIEMRAFDQAGKVSVIEPLYLYNPGSSFDSTIFDDLINFEGDQVNQRWQLESQGPSFDNGLVNNRLQSNSGNSALIRSNKTVPVNTRAVEMRFAAEGEAGIYWRDNAFRNWRILLQQNQNRLEIGHETSLQYMSLPAGSGGPLAKVRSLWRDGRIEIEFSRQGGISAQTFLFPQLRLANLSGQMEARTQSNFNSSVMDDIQLRALRPWDLFAIDAHSLKAGQSSKVRWPSFAGRDYVIETSATMASGSWSNAGQKLSTGTVTEHSFTLPSGSKRFVRVRELPGIHPSGGFPSLRLLERRISGLWQLELKTELLAVFGISTMAAAAQDDLPAVTVLAERRGDSVADMPGWTLAEWNQVQLSEEAPRTLDELLSQEPSFSLYRRQTSLFGNPTSAGVSLRNTGATAASRTLVLLDGIPQNDPFGGWVYWARHDPSTLDSVRIVPSARSVVWGNQSPAGVVQLASHSPFEERHLLRVGGGSQGTVSAASTHTLAADDGSLGVTFSAFGLHSDGFFAVPSWQRGTLDRRLDIDTVGADLKLAWKAAPGLVVEPMFSFYEEDRGNGTPLAGNSTEAMDFALRVTSEGEGGFSWQALAYHQRRRFESMFTSVNATRSAENPSLDQFHVPGNGSGGAFTLLWEPEGPWSLNAGADFRQIDGATNERASFIGGRFTRLRHAGGEQGQAGLFLAAGYETDAKTRIDASLRGDAWWLDNGKRLETSLVTGLPLRTNLQPDRDGLEPSFSLALTHPFTPCLQAGLSAGTSFRLPNLNELHRPFRVRNDITEANPNLDPERFYSIEGTVDWQAVDSLSFDLAVFHHWIRDAIANVPITDPAQIAAIFGTIPAGGSGQQRQNVDEARVLGLEAGVEWRPREVFSIGLEGIWSDTEFSESSKQPLLENKPFPQAPDLRLIASADWQALERLTLSAGYEYGSHQFDDALAARRIPSYTSARIGATWKAREDLLLHARVDNLFDEEIATGLSTDGIRTIAGPRSFWVGAEWGF